MTDTVLTAAEAGTAAGTYAAVHAEWSTANEQLDALVAKFREASPAERDEIRTQYGELVDKPNTLLPRLREAGLAAYKESVQLRPGVGTAAAAMSPAPPKPPTEGLAKDSHPSRSNIGPVLVLRYDRPT